MTDPDTLINIEGLRGSQFDGLPILNGAVQYAGTPARRARWSAPACCSISKACVAMAHKNARILWAVMMRQQGCDAQQVSAKPLAKQRPAPAPEPAAA